jgi:hypothetical protein
MNAIVGRTDRISRLCALLVAAGLAAAPCSAQRVAFVTSVTGTGDLGSWPDAGGQTGIAAGDAVCRARAAAAGLAHAQNFVAWLSDDAYCRVHGLAGARSGNCGQPSLPEAAGPWVRTDGLPFAGSIAELAGQGVVYLPVLLDEFGVEVPADASSDVFTASYPDGSLYPSDGACSDWTSAAPAELTAMGSSYKTTAGWSTAATNSCVTPVRLLCLETVAGPPLAGPAVALRRAFLTSASGTGDLSSWPQADAGSTGAEAGDSICRNLAQAAGFAEAASFRAWLSTAAAAAPARFAHDGAWMTPDAVVVAFGLADLTDGRLVSSIQVTEQGQYLGNYGVWTGTADDGVARPDRCQDWTSGGAGDSAASGATDRTIDGWSWSYGNTPCDAAYLHLYCLSDEPGPFFADGFEWGTGALWSATVQ